MKGDKKVIQLLNKNCISRSSTFLFDSPAFSFVKTPWTVELTNVSV